jgi:hypothetical protein
MIRAVRTAAPGLPVVLGADHQPWTTDKVGFSRSLLANELDVTTVHAWPYFSGFLDQFGEDDDTAWAIGAYLVQVAVAHQTTARPVWIQEIGVAPEWVQRLDVADATERLLRQALAVPDVAAVTWWASHDIRREYGGFNSVEYDLGLLDVRNQVKPVGRRFADVTAELRKAPRALPVSEQVVLVADAPADREFATRWVQEWTDRPPRITLLDNSV